MPKIPALPAISTPVAADELPIEDVSASTTKKITLGGVRDFLGIGSGWTPVTDTWTYASADAPSYVVTVPSGAASIYTLGMRVRLTHGATVKYFIITKVDDTALTLYGGTDYTISGTTISDVSVSTVKAPFGFPLNPAKWTQRTVDTSNRIQSSPTAGTFYNPGSLSLSIPIGAWSVAYYAPLVAYKTSSTTAQSNSSLSTANNSFIDSDFSCYNRSDGASGSMLHISMVTKRKFLALTAKTTYYLVCKTDQASSTEVGFAGSGNSIIIEAICAYL